MTSTDAITRSITHTEIVTIEGGPDLAAELEARCENWVEGNDGIREYWGCDDGHRWRVHLQYSA